MSNKVPPLSFNYSIKYNVGNKPQQAQAKPKVLTIAAIPDDHTLVVDAIDESGFEFNTSGNFIFPALSRVLRKEIILGGAKGGCLHSKCRILFLIVFASPIQTEKDLSLRVRLLTKTNSRF